MYSLVLYALHVYGISGLFVTLVDIFLRNKSAISTAIGCWLVMIGSLYGVTGNSGSLYGVTGNSGSLYGVTGNSGSLYSVTGNSGSLYGVTGNSGSLWKLKLVTRPDSIKCRVVYGCIWCPQSSLLENMEVRSVFGTF